MPLSGAARAESRPRLDISQRHNYVAVRALCLTRVAVLLRRASGNTGRGL